MKTRTKVVIIGGGIAGCSTLYHLTQEGWRDVVLLERDELTSGTTWHSAAQVTNFGATQTMVGLKSHSIALYKELSEDADYPINYHHADGGIRLANQPEQMEGYHHFASVARGMGVEFEVIDAAECARRHPLISQENLLGGLWDPLDGDIDPAQLCQALARRARRAGATVYRHTPVTGLHQRSDDTWQVQTDKGTIDCDIIVNAGGYRAGEVAAMMGASHNVIPPVISMEHQYFVTEPIAEIANASHRMPLLRCPISDYYCRQEKDGLLVGFYEQDCKTWGMDGIDPHFANALCPDDLDRVMGVLDGAFARMPALREVGIHTIVNGPITYSLDGAPLVGAIPHRRNAFCIIGLRAGVGEGGGHGWLLAQQIVHGEAVYDTWGLDPRRFTGYANAELTARAAVEEYQNEFRFVYPNEHRPAARGARTTPLTEILAGEGAAFIPVNGWERMDYIKPSANFSVHHRFGFDEAEPLVRAEVLNLRDNVGMSEVNGFNLIEITGADSRDFLDRLFCTNIKRGAGRVALGYLLNDFGMMKGEATLAYLEGGRIWYGSAAAAEWHDLDWLCQHRRAGEDVQINSLTGAYTTLVLAGPKSREVLAQVSRADWSVKAFPWLSVREAFIGIAPAVVMSVSFSGELAYEIHVKTQHLTAAYHALREAGDLGDSVGLKLFGARAIESMRMEKGFLHWKADIITEYDPFETGLARFVALNKGDFIGRDALMKRQESGQNTGQNTGRMRISAVVDSDKAPPLAGASVMQGDKVVGTITSGAYGHRVDKNLAYAFVDCAVAKASDLTLELLGERVAFTPIADCPYDAKHERMRK